MVEDYSFTMRMERDVETTRACKMAEMCVLGCRFSVKGINYFFKALLQNRYLNSPSSTFTHSYFTDALPFIFCKRMYTLYNPDFMDGLMVLRTWQ